MHHLTLRELSNGLHRKEYSSVELTQHFLKRIQQHAALNAFITVCEEQALLQAKQADVLLSRGEASPLTGIPIAQKDIFCTKGIKTSCGSKMLDNFIAPYDARTVTHFKQAGSVLLGKTNMDEFAMGSSTEHSYYGPTHNPWRAGYVPGGSSGGSAAAVAARLTAGATGTDTGGSIRQPAAVCGVTGLKPTYGRVSRYGMIGFASSLDQAGPITQTAEDAALMLNVMAGNDPLDSTSVDYEVPDYTATLDQSLTGLTVGLPLEYFDHSLDPKMASIIDATKKILAQLGVRFVDIHLPHATFAAPTYYLIAPAEASSNLARFDGVRYGYRCTQPKNLKDLYQRSRAEGFGPEVKRRVLIGTYALSAGYYDAYYVKAQRVRRLIQEDFMTAFRSVDAILAPSTPGPAFKIGGVTDITQLYLSDLYTIAANLAGLPALSMPAGFVDDLPVGVQLIGNYFNEARLLNITHQYQQATDWHKRTPQGF